MFVGIFVGRFELLPSTRDTVIRILKIVKPIVRVRELDVNSTLPEITEGSFLPIVDPKTGQLLSSMPLWQLNDIKPQHAHPVRFLHSLPDLPSEDIAGSCEISNINTF